jgi:hypothetical protein
MMDVTIRGSKSSALYSKCKVEFQRILEDERGGRASLEDSLVAVKATWGFRFRFVDEYIRFGIKAMHN